MVAIVGALYLVLSLIATGPVLSPRLPDFALHAGPTVTQAEADEILALVEEAEGILAGYAGGHLPSLEIFVHADRRSLAADLASWSGDSEADAWRVVSDGSWVHYTGAIFIDLTPPERPDYSAFWGVAHEVAHAFQERLYSPAVRGWERGECWYSHGRLMAPYGPMWLLEGGAERLSFRALVDSAYWEEYAEGHTEQQVKDELIAAVYAVSSQRLEFLANATYLAPDDYGLAFAAVARLEEGRSPEAVLRYYKRLGDGLCWNEAFEEVFGVTAGTFYGLFDGGRFPDELETAG